jgi:hypothetical protein
MKHLGVLKPDTLVTLLNWIGVPIVALYVGGMFVYPWFASDCTWRSVENVWDRWQSLNVGMLAFVSSITAFNIGRYNAEKQREREFMASKAFLPDALSGLASYFADSAVLLREGWEASRGNSIKTALPIPPPDFKVVFRDCIRHADREVGEYLARMLRRLQVHAARLATFVDQQSDDTWVSPHKYNLVTYIYRLGELQAMVNRLFPFARGQEPLDATALKWEDFKDAYGNLDFWIEDVRIDDANNLEAFTKRALGRADSMDTKQAA